MLSFWHNTVLGQYSPGDSWVGLDYNQLFLDPVRAEMTFFHEISHGILSTTTDFGQATNVVIRALPQIKSIDFRKKDETAKSLMSAQLFVQEGTASLMEILRLSQTRGKDEAISWAKSNLPPDYYERLEKLLFVFKMGKRYREEFTKKIPHIALHTGLRKAIVTHDLLSSPDKLMNYLGREENIPNVRFQKMIDIIRSNNYLVLKSPEELCKIAGITSYADTSKKDVAEFLNYIGKLSGEKHTFTENDIGEVLQGQEAIMKVNDNMIVANMNIGFRDKGEFLWKTEDFLHYKYTIEAIIISQFSSDFEHKREIEEYTGRKHDFGIMGFVKGGNRYSIGMDQQAAISLINDDLRDKTIIVKWGLYEPGLGYIKYLPGSCKPNVVIYNSIRNLEVSFEKWLTNNKAEYMHLGITADHPFQTLILKDSDGVIHLVNTFGNKYIVEFIKKYEKSLMKSPPTKLVLDPRHYNNTLSIWMGLSWDIDWLSSMVQKDHIVLRK